MITLPIFIVLLLLAIIIMFFAAQTQNPGFAVLSGIMFLILGFSMFPGDVIPFAGGISYLNGTTIHSVSLVESNTTTTDETSSNVYAQYSSATMGLLLIFIAMICFGEAFGMRDKKED